MSFDVVQSAQQLFTNFLGGIFSDEQTALQFLQDPNGALTEAGLDNKDLSSLNVQQAVVDACDYPGVPPAVKENLESYSAPSYSSAPPTVENVIQQVQQVTQVVHQDNREISNFVTNNVTDINVGDDFNGDIDVDNNTANAEEGGVATAGNDNDVNAVTGDNSNLLDNEDGTIEGNVNQNTGDGAVQAGDDITDTSINTGINSGVIADDISAPVVLGDNTGIVADGDVENANVGEDINALQINDVDGDVDLDDNQFNFGGGGNNTQQNDNEDSALASGGGDAINIDDSNVDGSAIGVDGGIDATDSFQDNDPVTDITDSENVNLNQGDGNQDVDQSDDAAAAV